jgi:hypothetical protein
MPSPRASRSRPRLTATPWSPGDQQPHRKQDDLLAQGPPIPGFGEVGHSQAAVGGQGDPGNDLRRQEHRDGEDPEGEVVE